MPGTQALLSIKQLILTVAIAFSVHSSNGHALEESMALPFALAVGKALITTPKPFIEVSSTKEVYVREVVALPLSDTQCLHTQIQEEQVCFGNNQPTRIRLLPDDQLKIGLHSLGISQVENILHPMPVADPLFPVQDGLSLPELDSMAKAIATEIQQGYDRQREIIEKAKQSRSLVLSRFRSGKSFEELEEDSDAIQWWGLKQEPDADDSDMAQARPDDSILLKPDTRYCFSPDSGTGAKAYNLAASDDGSGGEDSDTSDESSDNDSGDDESATESDVEYIGTTDDPFPVSKEVSEYCANQVLMRIKQEPTSDSEIPIESEVMESVTESDVEYIDTTSDPFPVSEEVREYCANQVLMRIKQEPTSDSEIPIESEVAEADSTNNLKSTPPTCQSLNPPTAKKKRKAGSKKYPCGHQGCDRSFAAQASLNSHKSQYHSGEKTCPDCQKPLKNAKALSDHKRTEHSGKQTCPHCQKTVSNAKALSTHKSQYHSGQRICPDCKETLPNMRALSDHKRQEHSGKQTCPDCQKIVLNTKALSTHKSQYHSGQRICPDCQKPLKNAKALSTHKRQEHSGQRICPDCQKTVQSAQALSDHKRKEHSGKQTCPHCPKTLKNGRALSNHKRIHRKRKHVDEDEDEDEDEDDDLSPSAVEEKE